MPLFRVHLASSLWLLSDSGRLFSAQNLAILQWSGLAVLTVALLVLMRTRWGQARPLSKCIALSVFAHILFMTYAYGTKLIFDYPEEPPETYIRLSVLPDENRSDSADPTEQETWNDFTTESIDFPAVEPPGRQEPGLVAAPVESTPVESRLPVPKPTAANVEIAEPERPQPEPTTHVDPVATASPSAVIQEVEAPQRDVVEPPLPTASPLARQRIENVPAAITESPVELDSQEMRPSSQQIQRLADLVPTDRPGDALLGDQDLPEASENRVETIDRSRALASTSSTATDDTSRENTREPLVAVRPTPQTRGTARRIDGSPLPDVYSLRTPEGRAPVLQRYGGTPQTEDSVAAALAWLAANQQADGHWDADRFGAGQETRPLGQDRRAAGSEADSGITGLALLALLGSGNSHLEGMYRGNVRRALQYLAGIQQQDGSLAGRASLFAKMYCHGIATLALSEAYAVTGDRQLEPYVQRAIDYTLAAQHPVTGGWRYQPGDRGDMSQFGWQVMALKSAELAGIDVPTEARAGMVRFLAEVSSGREGGLASYRRGERVSPVMTAEALVCRYFLGRHRDVRRVREATDFVVRQQPGGGSVNLYYWYYGTLALFQVQGPAWESWNRALQRELLLRQQVSGRMAGSWDPDTVWGGYGGRVYSTAMATLCLEVYYRYLPVYEQRE